MAKSFLAIGLMSGTSRDSIDAALIEIKTISDGIDVELKSFISCDYQEKIKEKLFMIMDQEQGKLIDICELNFLLAENYVEAIKKLLASTNLTAADIDFIGSHGQTIYHIPAGNEHRRASTLQLGSGAVIAQKTGITTVHNFRQKDMASGGQGAPLVPMADFLLYGSTTENRVLLNIGGVANFTYLEAQGGPEKVIAFDTGPGNMIIDSLVQHFTNGEKMYDSGGGWARSGQINQKLLAELKTHPYYAISPPKSTGREEFGYNYLQQILAANQDLERADLLKTITYLTAVTITDAFKFCPQKIDSVIVSGGGVKNQLLLEFLQELNLDKKVAPLESIGGDSIAKEAICFGLLAYLSLKGLPGNIKGVTGALAEVVLGDITFGGAGKCVID